MTPPPLDGPEREARRAIDAALAQAGWAVQSRDELVNKRYLLWMFKSPVFRRFVASLNTGSLIQHMFTSQLDEFCLPLPPLEEQNRIVAEVDRLLSSATGSLGGVRRLHYSAARDPFAPDLAMLRMTPWRVRASWRLSC